MFIYMLLGRLSKEGVFYGAPGWFNSWLQEIGAFFPTLHQVQLWDPPTKINQTVENKTLQQWVQHLSPKRTLQVSSAQVYNVHCHSAHCVLCTVLLCSVQCRVRWVGALCSVTNYFLCIVPYHNPCPPKQKISFVCFQIFPSPKILNFVYSKNQDSGYLIYP